MSSEYGVLWLSIAASQRRFAIVWVSLLFFFEIQQQVLLLLMEICDCILVVYYFGVYQLVVAIASEDAPIFVLHEAAHQFAPTIPMSPHCYRTICLHSHARLRSLLTMRLCCPGSLPLAMPSRHP
jgi:hypothetical protein